MEAKRKRKGEREGKGKERNRHLEGNNEFGLLLTCQVHRAELALAKRAAYFEVTQPPLASLIRHQMLYHPTFTTRNIKYYLFHKHILAEVNRSSFLS